jgi:hypothetical protein
VEQQTKKRMQLALGRTELAGDVIIGMTQVQVSLDTEPMTVMTVRIAVDGKCADGGYRVRRFRTTYVGLVPREKRPFELPVRYL